MGRVVRDVVAILDRVGGTLESEASPQGEHEVTDFDFCVRLDPEIEALKLWVKDQGDLSSQGWQTLMTLFGREWRFDANAA